MKTAIIVAAGKGTRLQKDFNKVNYLIKQKPLYLYSAEVFLNLGYEVILVLSEEEIEKQQFFPNMKVVVGGKSRSESVYQGLKVASGDDIYVHDGARPLLDEQMVKGLELELTKSDGAFLAKPMVDSLKQIKEGKITTIDKESYYLAQTPQAFRKSDLIKAYQLKTKEYPDEVSLINDLLPNLKISPVINYRPNDKITYFEDLVKVKKLFGREFKIGHSFDIHELVRNRPLYLGGIEIPANYGLLGHSDADVLLHVVCEAILGALAKGDLGTNFPDYLPQYKNIRSEKLVKEALNKLVEEGYEIANLDALLYLESTKLEPYIFNMRENIAKILGLTLNKVSIKATTTEKIGPIGEDRAIAAEAVVLIKEII